MEVGWLEQNVAAVPAEDGWLGAREMVLLARLRFEKRRTDWRLGRWAAKRAVAAYMDLALDVSMLARIEILPAPSGAPEVFLAGQAAPVTISLSHRAGAACCAVADYRAELGCDLEWIEPRSEAFAGDYFTGTEQLLAGRASGASRDAVLALLWSAKESTLKALRYGLRADPLSVNVDVPIDVAETADGQWRPLAARYQETKFAGWWQHSAGFVRTMVCRPDATIRRLSGA